MTAMRKPPFWATALTVAGVSVLCTLGTWQLQRLEWKEGLLTKINAHDDGALSALSVSDLTPENEFLKGRLNGRYLFDKEITLQPRTHDGKPGIHVITPFVLENANTILINRGWVPLDTQWSQDPQNTLDVILRVPKRPNKFVPNNTPEQGEWYALDVEQIAKAKALNDPLVVIGNLLPDQNVDQQQLPDPSALTINLNNNHLQYAIFWYTMALTMITIYVLRFLKPVRKPD